MSLRQFGFMDEDLFIEKIRKSVKHIIRKIYPFHTLYKMPHRLALFLLALFMT